MSQLPHRLAAGLRDRSHRLRLEEANELRRQGVWRTRGGREANSLQFLLIKVQDAREEPLDIKLLVSRSTEVAEDDALDQLFVQFALLSSDRCLQLLAHDLHLFFPDCD